MSPAVPTSPSQSLRTFGTVWLGQLISKLGTGLTNFALGAYVYNTSGSVTRFALVIFFSTLPLVLISPVAGILADRLDRRKLMVLGDLGAAFSIFLIWALFAGQDAGLWTIQHWYFYLPVFLGSACSALCYPAWMASVPLLVPKRHLGRASGMTELSAAVAHIGGPLLAASLDSAIGLSGILLLDSVSYFFSIGALLLVRFPAPPPRAPGRHSLKEDLAESWHFIRERPGLRGLLLFITGNTFAVGMVMLLINPLVLAFTDIHSLKWIAAIAGMGGLLGGIVMSVWGGPRRRILGLVGFPIVGALVLLLAVLPPSVPLIASAAAVFIFTFPLISGCNQVIWQTKVPAVLQGRVASLRRVVFQGTNLVVTLVAGFLADRLFEPWMAPGGALASSVGRVIGTGQGRGIAVMFLMLSVLMLTNVVALWLSPRVRNVETELPDALPVHPATASTAPASPAPGDTGAPARLATSGGTEA
ncbi:MFS transporter [Pyxidicoccus xibeiensis]|uniref:MFS transporter n=1 Tax=Pyxidicoccus xibeiensis TaxID=2906759 RepID=UPI0020A70432|nr:MFS transporter [Pyxidicoccus xibeiensis]MCP3145029.1 MFS transporter [Pyxidicoccus xibeiensis]